MKYLIGGVIVLAILIVYAIVLSPFIIAGQCSRREEEMRANGELPGTDKPE